MQYFLSIVDLVTEAIDGVATGGVVAALEDTGDVAH